MSVNPRRHVAGTVGRVFRFGIVGVANTTVYYVAYLILLQVFPYLLAHVVAFALGVVFSFFANCYVTFKVKPTWRRFIEFPATTLVNFTITTLGTWLLVEGGLVSKQWATLLMAVVAIPFTYLATAFVLARPRHHEVAAHTTEEPETPTPNPLTAKE